MSVTLSLLNKCSVRRIWAIACERLIKYELEPAIAFESKQPSMTAMLASGTPLSAKWIRSDRIYQPL